MAPGPDPPDKYSNNRFHLLGDYFTSAPKKHKLDDFPILQTPRPDTNTNPKYVIISSSDPKKSLSDFSPFALQKSIESISKDINSISQLRDGNLLILARNQRAADKFLKTKSLGLLCTVSCYLHPSLNSVKGVIYAPCLNKVPEKEIVDELKDQGVIDIYKFTRLEDDGKSRSPTGKMVLTFNLYRLPPIIDVAWYKCKVEHYFPNPMRCKNCQKLGHTLKKCNGNPTCPQCSLPPHDNAICSRTLCTNCSGEHPSTDTKCPRYIQSKEILKIKTINYCSMSEARRRYQSNNPSPNNKSTRTYASVTSDASSKHKETVNQQTLIEKHQNTTTTNPVIQPLTSDFGTNYSRTLNSTGYTNKHTASLKRTEPSTSTKASESSTSTKTTEPSTPTKISEPSTTLQSLTSYTLPSGKVIESSTKSKQNSSSQSNTGEIQSPISNLTQQLINTNAYYIPSESPDGTSMESWSP